jgi:hypothetical protein
MIGSTSPPQTNDGRAGFARDRFGKLKEEADPVAFCRGFSILFVTHTQYGYLSPHTLLLA